MTLQSSYFFNFMYPVHKGDEYEKTVLSIFNGSNAFQLWEE